MRKSALVFTLALITAIVGELFAPAEPGLAAGTSAFLSPASYVTQRGSATGDVTAMKVKDQSGTADDPARYVLFSTPSSNYNGYRNYFITGKIHPANVTKLQLRANVFVPAPGVQRWTWRLYDWKSRGWVPVGNTTAAVANRWMFLYFDLTSNPARFINTNRQIRVQFASNNAAGNAKVDLESVRVFYSTTCGETYNIAFEAQVLTLINVRRANADAPALTRDSRLDAAARLHTVDMACNNYFDHNSLDGTTPWERITRQGYDFWTAAENIAAGYTTPASVVNGWMNSPGHRANILNPDLIHIGIGYAYTNSSDYGYYRTNDFASPAP